MYKENTTKAIAKKRYSFRKGYLQVTLKDRDELREELKNILRITQRSYFYNVMNAGIIDISLPRFEAINQAFARRNITDVWDITELPQSSRQEKAK